ncbi:MAG: FAD-dependent oxidoreductase [Symploca sp. SIO2D2]|nr:FAD-dependent oxidoreductase [Symploca sp. SIO2D2]
MSSIQLLNHLYHRRRFLQLSLFATGLAWACSPANQKSDPGKVLVIGAGIAGLAAARKLQSQGKTVTVLEGRDRLGGRIVTNRSLGLPIDLGASWIHGVRRNPITKLARDFQLTTLPTDYESLQLFLDGRVLSPDIVKKGRKLTERLLSAATSWGYQQDEDVSLDAGIQQILSKKQFSVQEQQVIKWWLDSEVVGDLALDLDQLSLHEWQEGKEFSGDDYLFPNGYDQIIEKLAADLDLRLEEKVVEIKYGNQEVVVTTENNSFSGAAAIVTLPLGVLKSNTVKFNPPLPPAKQQAIKRLAVGLFNKVVLLFPQQFWDKQEIIGSISQNPTNFHYFLNYAHYQDKPVLIAFTGGSYARLIESLSESELVAAIMGNLRQMYGKTIPNPQAVLRTQWATEPFAYGSYSASLPVGVTSTEREILAQSVDNLLFFAGEATSSNYPGTVHGAFLSGVKAASEI